MNILLLTIITFSTAFLGVALIHPYLVRFAKAKNIVDNPNTRKLQLRPVPVLGGLAIFFGIVAGVLVAHTMIDSSQLFVIISCMMIMTYVGALDDVLDISPIIRLITQIITVLILIYIGDVSFLFLFCEFSVYRALGDTELCCGRLYLSAVLDQAGLYHIIVGLLDRHL